MVLYFLIGAAVLYLWVLPLWNGFWLDECIALYMVQGGLSQIVPRSFIGFQSLGYSIVEWIMLQLGATTEPVLRLPSLFAGLATVYVLYRLGTEVLDPEFGLTVAALFASMPLLSLEIPNARPYPIAMLAQAGGWLWLFRWLRSSRIRDGLLWIVCSSVAAYLHLLFLIPIGLAGLYVIFIFAKRSPAQLVQVAICGMAGAVLVLPLAPQLLEMARQSHWLSIKSDAPWAYLPQALVPLSTAVAVVLTLALGWISGRRPHWRVPPGCRDAPTLGAWVLIPPVVIYFAITKYAETPLFVSRYVLPSMIGGVLLWGWLIRGIEPPRVRNMSVVMATVFGIVLAARFAAVPGLVPNYRNEDWRAAANALPRTGYVLLYPGLAETQRLERLRVPERKQYMTTPVTFFRPDVSPERTELVPLTPGTAERAYMQPVVGRVSAARQQVTIVARAYPSGPEWAAWLSDQLVRAGFRKVQDSTRGQIIVTVWAPSS